MSAATNPPIPTLNDILTILENVESITASFDTSGYSFSNAETSEYITLNFRFRRSAIGFKAAPFVFEYPRSLFPEIARAIRKLYQEQPENLERAYREVTKKSIADVMGFVEQEMKQDTNALGTLYTKMRREHFQDALKYLRELGRRRRDADERMEHEAEERLRKAADEEIKRREQAERERQDREGQEAKRRRWEDEEEARRKRRSKQTSDSGYARGSREETLWNAYRAAGGFEHFNQDAKKSFDDIFRQAFEGGFYGTADYAGTSSNRSTYEEAFRQKRGGRSTPPPNGKRKWYEVLGCAPGANRDEIRKAARAKTGDLHPDKPGNRTPEKLAELQAVNEAKAEGLGGI
jgi:uncharacterized protein YbjQ (UPF0145 family)